MTFFEIAQRRLASQQLLGTSLAPAKLLEWFAAMQAQEYAQTKWAFGLRLPGTNDADLEGLFSSGKILRTHVLRPTWHFVSARDIRWMLELSAPRVHAANAYMYRKLELDKTLLSRCHKLMTLSLEGGKQLTREALNEVFQRNRIVAQGHRLGYIMMHAELEGLICSGAREGNQFTYALLDERARTSKRMPREESLPELAKRYFSSRGPATVKDFATWSGLSLTDCKKAAGSLTGIVQKEVVGSIDYYFDDRASVPRKTDKRILLLPTYDEFIMGYRDRSAIFQIRQDKKPKPGERFDSMVVQDGQVIGAWKRTVEKNRLVAQFRFFNALSKEQLTAWKKAMKRLEEFTGMNIQVNGR